MVHPVALICFSGKDVRDMHHGMYGYFDNITRVSVCSFMHKTPLISLSRVTMPSAGHLFLKAECTGAIASPKNVSPVSEQERLTFA